MKVEGILRATGFFELIAGALLIVYAEGNSYALQCPAFTHPCGPQLDVDLYNAVGLVLLLIGLIQIAASVYISRGHSPTKRVSVSPPVVTVEDGAKNQTITICALRGSALYTVVI